MLRPVRPQDLAHIAADLALRCGLRRGKYATTVVWVARIVADKHPTLYDDEGSGASLSDVMQAANSILFYFIFLISSNLYHYTTPSTPDQTRRPTLFSQTPSCCSASSSC